jgi:hypothetical protein
MSAIAGIIRRSCHNASLKLLLRFLNLCLRDLRKSHLPLKLPLVKVSIEFALSTLSVALIQHNPESRPGGKVGEQLPTLIAEVFF